MRCGNKTGQLLFSAMTGIQPKTRPRLRQINQLLIFTDYLNINVLLVLFLIKQLIHINVFYLPKKKKKTYTYTLEFMGQTFSVCEFQSLFIFVTQV